MKLTNYSSFIHKSRYSRFIDEQGRRENWSETVERYMGFMKKQLLDKHKYEIPQHIYKTVHKAILILACALSISSSWVLSSITYLYIFTVVEVNDDVKLDAVPADVVTVLVVFVIVGTVVPYTVVDSVYVSTP